MRPFKCFFATGIILCASLTVIALPLDAQNSSTTTSFPYIGQIIGDSVNVRSGPGTNYYSCGKLSRLDMVKVVGQRFSWSRIVPPKESFSWISSKFVTIDANNPNIGSISGNGVRVYAGSNTIKPMHSTTVQTKLNKDRQVTLFGEQIGGYYKIIPPKEAYLWVSTPFIKHTKQSSKTNVPIVTSSKKSSPVTSVISNTNRTIIKSQKTSSTKRPRLSVVSAQLPAESKALNKYYEIAKNFKAEKQKPLDQQNFTAIKKALQIIGDNKQASKASSYAIFTIKQIQSFELAKAVSNEIKLQDSQFAKSMANLDKSLDTKFAKSPDHGKYNVIGTFAKSAVYSRSSNNLYWRLIDAKGSTLCYAVALGDVAKKDLTSLVDQKVGLIGIIVPHPQSEGTLVKFTDIEQIK